MASTTLHMPDGTNVSPDMYIGWLEEYDAADEAIAQAVAERKDLRAKIKAAGIPLKAFDRARADAAKASAVREHEAVWYQTMLAWQGKPVGYQASMDLDDDAMAAAYQRRLSVADKEGYETGKAGRAADECSWPAGSEGAQRWLSAWTRGQSDKVWAENDPAKAAEKPKTAKVNGANGSANGHAEPKRRGRPKGSKNQPKAAADERL